MFVTRDLDKNRFSNKTKRDFDVIQSKLYDIKKILRITNFETRNIFR